MRFFSVFYFAINFGSFLSMIITPVIRGEYFCQVVRLNVWLEAAHTEAYMQIYTYV